MRYRTATTFYLSQRCMEVKLAVAGTMMTPRSMSFSNGNLAYHAYIICSFVISLPQVVRMSLA